MSERYVCIHGHFYQPPRENPWLDTVERQDSAYPYHDWNERITAECYQPNAVARILDGEGKIVRIVNNYAHMSYNFGPTLLRWLEEKEPDTYRRVLEADRLSREKFSGHGSAMAQAYNHMILPLANRHDRVTQIEWGIKDFVRRFGREPEGMWLAEAAADALTLDLMAERGIKFTVLAPTQANRARSLEGGEWQDVSGGRIDPTRPYVQKLASGRSIAIFFYDGPVSRAVAFEKLLTNGERLSGRLLSIFTETGRDWPQLAHIATDGETYGHHHRHGEMALAYALSHLEKSGARLTNYGEYLEKFPPRVEVEIHDQSSWSCVHGVERWKSDCGCNSGMKPGWNQAWRGPLRGALDWLRDALAQAFEQRAGALLRDAWAARDDYISVLLDGSPENVQAYLDRHASRSLSPDERVTVLKLLKTQHHAQLMYTSCGWFFDELSGIESVQVLQYAGCAIRMGEEVTGLSLEGPFKERLEKAPSNLPEHGNGRVIYEKYVAPAAVDLEKVAAHFAVSSLFESYAERAKVYSYDVERRDGRALTAGKAKLGFGRIHVASRITGETAELSYAVLHLGDHNITGGLRHYHGFSGYKAMTEALATSFSKADLPETMRVLDKSFPDTRYSLRSLFYEEQRKVLDTVLESTIAEAEAMYRQLYEHNAALLRFLTELRAPLPKTIQEAAGLVLNTALKRALSTEPLDAARIRELLDEARRARVTLDGAGLGFALEATLERMTARLSANADDLELLRALQVGSELANSMPFEVDLGRVQNGAWALLESVYVERAPHRDNGMRDWVDSFVALAGNLGIRMFAPPAKTAA
jgi:alpha-amylase/alpha-mannosidase (GH57 family)